MKIINNSFGLGAFRFFLAFLVAISHLWEDMLPGPAAYAVWGFFVLSGFLMTLVLRNKYGITREGIKNYLFNRWLRIYPSYIVGCLFGIVILFVLRGENTTVLNPAFFFPERIIDYVGNIIMSPFHLRGYFVPVAGALFTEVWAYMLMPFSASSKSAAWLGLILSIFANCNYGFEIASFADRYSLFAPAIIGFFVGSLCQHYMDYLSKVSMPMVSLLVWCLHACLWWVSQSYPWKGGIYVSLLCSAWVVVSLFPKKTGSLDKLLGDMSYLVYLLHTTVGMCLYWYFGNRTFAFFLVVFMLTVLLSYIMVVCYERPLQQCFKRNYNKAKQ